MILSISYRRMLAVAGALAAAGPLTACNEAGTSGGEAQGEAGIAAEKAAEETVAAAEREAASGASEDKGEAE